VTMEPVMLDLHQTLALKHVFLARLAVHHVQTLVLATVTYVMWVRDYPPPEALFQLIVQFVALRTVQPATLITLYVKLAKMDSC
jgi:hypothetical protein